MTKDENKIEPGEVIPEAINKWFCRPVKWIVWDLSGLHAIYVKMLPHSKATTDAPDYKPPITIGIWLFSIYFACLGFATARYERMLDRAEFKYNTLTTQLAAGMPFDRNRVDEVGEFEIPLEPKFELKNYNFIVSLWDSFFAEKELYRTRHNRIYIHQGKRVTEKIKNSDDFLLMMVELWKHRLTSVSLFGANLEGANLSEANLTTTATLEHLIF